ncbi:hypothetical protein [Poriferisphaera sp. WC338]|uniref:hypothetical protein n=1 Tax=Poriferisphaera sp. WC338 TaxID=3425129 RepID=UPI003D812B5D
MFVNVPCNNGGDNQTILYLFSNRKKALEFLNLWDPNELNDPQEVIEFTYKNIPLLLKKMAEASVYCKLLAVDPNPNNDPIPLTSIEDFIHNFTQIINRIKRLFSSGINSIAIQTHSTDKGAVLSYYCHDGLYAAMIKPNGQVHFAKTREQAVSECLI